MNVYSESVEVKDISTKTKNEKEAYGAGVSFGGDTAQTNFGTAKDNTEGTQFGIMGSYKKADGSTVAANRDLGNTSVISKTEKTDDMVNLDVDTRMLTNATKYVQDTAGNVVGLPGNAIKTGQRAVDAASDMVDATAKSGSDVGKILDKQNDKTARREALAEMTPQELDVVANPQKYNETEKRKVADKYSQAYAKVRGIDAADSQFFDRESIDPDKAIDKKGLDKRNMIGITDGNKNKDDIYYEADDLNNGNNFAKLLGHENKRQDQVEKGIKNNTPDGISTKYDLEAKDAGNHNLEALKREVTYKGVTDENSNNISYTRTQADLNLIQKGTAAVGEVKDAQPKLFVYNNRVVDPDGKKERLPEGALRNWVEYGNWGGPGLSGGNVKPPLAPINDLDANYMKHDLAYAACNESLGGQIKADVNLIVDNIFKLPLSAADWNWQKPHTLNDSLIGEGHRVASVTAFSLLLPIKITGYGGMKTMDLSQNLLFQLSDQMPYNRGQNMTIGGDNSFEQNFKLPELKL